MGAEHAQHRDEIIGKVGEVVAVARVEHDRGWEQGHAGDADPTDDGHLPVLVHPYAVAPAAALPAVVRVLAVTQGSGSSGDAGAPRGTRWRRRD